MATEIRGRPSIRESREKYLPSSPVTGRNSRPSSITRSDGESESESDTERIHHSPTRKSRSSESTIDYSPESFKTNNCSNSSASQTTILAFLGISFLIVAIVVPVVYLKNPVDDENKHENKYKNCSFVALEKSYPSQNEILWRSLRIGIEGILNNEQPSPAIYLLLHDGKKSSRNLVKDVALRASECFDPKSKPIELNAKDFSSEAATNDYGVIVQLYKEKIKEGGVAIVANLNEIPPKTARALHAICDTYTPIAHKAVIFLTLVPTTNKGKPIEIAEKTLLDIWSSKITDYEIDPLLARVTDQVFQLNPF